MHPIEITILHTNDMHGRIEPMTRLSGLAKRMRAEAEALGRTVFFWDAGDPLDRSFRVCGLSKGAAMAGVLNAMGYGLMTMGNDISLTYGPQAMVSLAARLAFPVLAANARDGDGPLLAGLHESVLLPVAGGAALGVFGLTAPWGGAYASFGLHTPDEMKTAQRVVDSLRRSGATAVLALSHLGLEDDRRMAEAVPGIDVIIGGHSHSTLEHGLEHGSTLIAQAGQYAEALGVVELELEPRTGRMLRRQARLERVPMDGPADPAVVAAVAEAEAEVEALAATAMGESLGELHLAFQEECSLGNVAADALRERMGAEAAVIISGSFRQGLPAGVLTLGDLDAATSSTANPQATQVRGSQILDALERGLDPAVATMRPTWARGSPVGRPQISGMTVEYDPRRGTKPRILRLFIGGRPVQTDRLYLLAHTDAETAPGVHLLTIESGQSTKTEVPTVMREVLEDYLRAHSPIAAPPLDRWRLVG